MQNYYEIDTKNRLKIQELEKQMAKMEESDAKSDAVEVKQEMSEKETNALKDK